MIFSEAGCSITAPTFEGYLVGFDMVFNSLLSRRGVISSQLVSLPATKLEAWMSLLDHQQLSNLNRSMGITQDGSGGYNLCVVEFTYEDGNDSVNCYSYIPGENPAYIDKDSHKPIRFATSEYKGDGLTAYEDFIPINIVNRRIEQGEKIICEMEMMQLL